MDRLIHWPRRFEACRQYPSTILFGVSDVSNTGLLAPGGEGFGGPYSSGSTDVGTGIVYAVLFLTLLTFAPPARRERMSADHSLVSRWSWWRVLAEPHAVDRVSGALLIEPVAVGQT